MLRAFMLKNVISNHNSFSDCVSDNRKVMISQNILMWS